jgi:hypothetical protein
MQKYAVVIDAEKCLCEVGIGDADAIFSRMFDEDGNELIITVGDYYVSLGMTLMDVEQGHDGNWYLAGHVPAPPAAKTIRTFAKDAIWVATKDLTLPDGVNAWQAFKDFLTVAELKEGWDQQAYLLEDNPFFEMFYPQAVAVFGKELVDSVLAASVVESKTVTLGD